MRRGACSTLAGGITSSPLPSTRLEYIVDHVHTHDPYGPFGAKGAGEASSCSSLAAIANGVYDAVGVRIRDLPITAEKILAELKKKEGK